MDFEKKAELKGKCEKAISTALNSWMSHFD
jgi:hypothetical protein